MTALADASEVEARLGREFTAAEIGRIGFLLDDVSAVVRSYCGRQFTSGSATVRLRASNGTIWLPERPVTAVTAVEDINGNAVSFVWNGLDKVTVGSAAPLNSFEINYSYTMGPRVFDVTYTGGSGVPDDVKAVVCQMAARALGRPADEAGTTQESIAGYSYSVGAAAAAGPAGMLADEKAVLDRYRRVGNTIHVG